MTEYEWPMYHMKNEIIMLSFPDISYISFFFWGGGNIWDWIWVPFFCFTHTVWQVSYQVVSPCFTILSPFRSALDMSIFLLFNTHTILHHSSDLKTCFVFESSKAESIQKMNLSYPKPLPKKVKKKQKILKKIYRVSKKSETLDFRYFEIWKYSIFWFHQIKHCLLNRTIPRSYDLVW